MTTAYVLTGLPASGKTTAARSLFPAVRFNLDDIRAMGGFDSGSDHWSREREAVAVATMIAGAKAAVLAGHDIVLDNCHVTPSLPREYRKTLLPLGVEFKVHDLTHVSVEECIARDAARANPVGEDVIRRLAASYDKARKNNWRLTDKWMNGTKWPEPAPYVANRDLPAAYIVDIDGTVALNNGHRGHYDYDERVLNDEPNWPVIRVVRRLGTVSRIVFVSGREDRCREWTMKWLMENFGFYYAPALFMRPTGDHRPDYVIKAEIFDAEIRDNYNVLGVFDDRDRVVATWRKMGLTVFQVAPGDF